MYRRSGGHRGAARNGPYSKRECSSVARLDDDVFNCDAERVRADLSKYGGVALSLAGRAGLDKDLPVGLHANGRAFERRQAGMFDIARNAPPEITPAFKRFLLPLKKSLAAAFQHGIKARLVIASDVTEGRSVAGLPAGGVWKLF